LTLKGVLRQIATDLVALREGILNFPDL